MSPGNSRGRGCDTPAPMVGSAKNTHQIEGHSTARECLSDRKPTGADLFGGGL